MKRYINIKQGAVRETLEEFDTSDFGSVQNYHVQVTVRLGSYRMIHKNAEVYVSRRACAGWTGN